MISMKGIAVLTLLALATGACGGADPTLLPAETTPDDLGQIRGPVYLSETELLIMESYPLQVALRVQGELPTPCHTLQWDVAGANDHGEIEVELFSLAPASGDCIQVLEPFEESISLGSYQGGRFTVLLNGEEVGGFDA